jgi:hypothetical protein
VLVRSDTSRLHRLRADLLLFETHEVHARRRTRDACDDAQILRFAFTMRG